MPVSEEEGCRSRFTLFLAPAYVLAFEQ
eukprot:SAG11_NODE_26331_length_346_cov_1.688259_1_plen_27_part_10